jgi:hypothetical protein
MISKKIFIKAVKCLQKLEHKLILEREKKKGQEGQQYE